MTKYRWIRKVLEIIVAPLSFILLGIIFSFLYQNSISSGMEEMLYEVRKSTDINESKVVFIINLKKDVYLLKVKHSIYINGKERVHFNNKALSSSLSPYFVKRSKATETSYFYIPVDLVKDGANVIQIYFGKRYPEHLDLFLSNFRKNIDESIFVLFKNASYINGEIDYAKLRKTFLIFLMTFGGWFLLINYVILRRSTLIEKIIHLLFPLLPTLILLISVWIYSQYSKWLVVRLVPSFIWGFVLISFLAVEGILFWKRIFMILKKKEADRVSLRKTKVIKINLNSRFTKNIISVAQRAMSCKLSDKFIFLCLILLPLSSILFIGGMKYLSKPLIHIAYFFLILGEGIRFIKIIKKRDFYRK